MSNNEQNTAEKLWEEIKDKNINMFSLPGQTVEQYLSPVMVEPSKLYMQVKDKNATAVLPALEDALGKNFIVEIAGRFICVSHSIKPSS